MLICICNKYLWIENSKHIIELLYVIFYKISAAGTSKMMSKYSGQSYRPGDVILRCKIPFAYVVNQHVADSTCDECLKTLAEGNQEKFLRCSGMYVM